MAFVDKAKGPKEKTGGVLNKEMYRFFHNEKPNKSAIVLLVVILVLGAVGVFFLKEHGKTDKVDINIGESQMFSADDLKEAEEATTTFFSRQIKDSELVAVSYNEAFSQKKAKEYCKQLKGKNPRKPEDIIIMQIDFDTGENPPQAYEPNKEYRGYTVLVAREGAMKVWRVVGDNI